MYAHMQLIDGHIQWMDHDASVDAFIYYSYPYDVQSNDEF